MKIKCLILDHDDTVVDSTATVHFPAHLEVMKKLRPNHPVINLNTWFEKNFDPGIITFLTEEIGPGGSAVILLRLLPHFSD